MKIRQRLSIALISLTLFAAACGGSEADQAAATTTAAPTSVANTATTLVDEATTSTTEPLTATTTTAAETTTTTAGEPAAVPQTWLGIALDGGINRVTTADGTKTFIAERGNPRAGVEEGGPSFYDAVWEVPEGNSLAASFCCEPASGRIEVWPETSPPAEDEFLPADYMALAATPSRDGTAIALVINSLGLAIGQGSGASPQMIREVENYSAVPAAWLTDRRGIAWTPQLLGGDAQLEVVELGSDNTVTSTMSTDLGFISVGGVAVRADGAIVVAGCTETTDDGSCTTSEVRVFDSETLEQLTVFDIEAGARLGSYDPSGTYLIYTDGTDTARWVGAGTSGVLGEGYYWADW